MTGVRRIVRTSPLLVPETSDLRRDPPRPVELRPANYMEKFDGTTVAYDVFKRGDDVWLVGPPLRNFRAPLLESLETHPDQHLKVSCVDLNRAYEAIATGGPEDREYIDAVFGGFEARAQINRSELGLFADCNVLVTLSKDNKLNWITDWARFYAQNHGVNAVLFYDNASSRYDAQAILGSLDLPELDVVVVVEWPFKYGPQGGRWEDGTDYPWDSDFCQSGVLTHARRRFLERARYVVNHDIDELAITRSGCSLFDHVDSSPNGYIVYSGQWIETVSASVRDAGADRTFADFCYFRPSRARTTTKWAIDPTRASGAEQWRAHWVAGINENVESSVMHRHFAGITTGWKYDRQDDYYSPLKHALDVPLFLTQRGSRSCIRENDRLLSMFWSRHGDYGYEDKMSAPDALLLARDLIAPERRFPKFFTRAWFWRDNTLIFECTVLPNARVAFELSVTDKRIDLVVTARDAPTWDILRLTMGPLGSAIEGRRRHLCLRVWPLGEPIETVAGDTLVLIERALLRVNFDITAAGP